MSTTCGEAFSASQKRQQRQRRQQQWQRQRQHGARGSDTPGFPSPAPQAIHPLPCLAPTALRQSLQGTRHSSTTLTTHPPTCLAGLVLSSPGFIASDARLGQRGGGGRMG